MVSDRLRWICRTELVGLFIYLSMMQSKGVVSETQVCVKWAEWAIHLMH